MDNKTWLWRKRSSEKTIIAAAKSDSSSNGNVEVILPTEKEVNLERALGNLNEKLASVLCELNAKDELLAKHAKMAEEANTNREKAVAEAVSLKQELDKALQQKTDSDEKLTQLNAALKESMQQLTFVREEHDQRIRDTVMKTSRELEMAQKKLEEKLTEKCKRLSNLTVENTRLSKTLLVNDKLRDAGMSQPIPIGALASALANASPSDQRTMLGENLYPLVEQLEPEYAAKVTGMLLEMDQTEVLHLLESPEALKAKVAEAMEVLRNVQQQQVGNPADQLAALSLNDGIVS